VALRDLLRLMMLHLAKDPFGKAVLSLEFAHLIVVAKASIFSTIHPALEAPSSQKLEGSSAKRILSPISKGLLPKNRSSPWTSRDETSGSNNESYERPTQRSTLSP
jgi:hypothetical protein